jgi:hypothetical protein
MLHLSKDKPVVLCDRISRREWFQVGGAAALGLSLPGMLWAEAVAG